jgi:hypothetical protein
MCYAAQLQLQIAKLMACVLLLPICYTPQVDYKALVSAVEKMSAEQFENLDLDQLVSQYSR